MRRRILGLMMSFVLVLSVFPLEMVHAETLPAAVYVSDTGEDTNAGTSASTAVKTINRALDLAEDGTTIYVDGSVYIEPLGGTDDPLIIEKEVTIMGVDATDRSVINVRTGGVILGADVTFRNVTYGPESFIRPAIAANGHVLTLIDVQQNANTRPLQIYGGTLYDITESIDFGASYAGTSSEVNIIGGSYQAVYAGSVNGSATVPVSIHVSNTEGEKSYSLSLEGIFAGGTQKIETSEAGSIPTLTDAYTVGALDVTVSNVHVATVSGMKAENDISLTVGSQNLYSCAIDNIDNLTVAEGVFAPTGSWNSRTNVTLSGSATDKATSDLSGFAQALEVQDFTDNGAPNILVLPDYVGEDASLVINGTRSGTTELRTTGGMPWSSEDYPGSSGMMEYEHVYVTTASGEGSFVISNPYPTQGGYGGIEITKENGSPFVWKTTEAPDYVVELVSFAFAVDEVTAKYEDVNIMKETSSAVEIPLRLEFPGDYIEDDCYISLIPLSYKIIYNSNEYNYTPSVDDYYGDIVDLNLRFDPVKDSIYVTKIFDESLEVITDPVAAGTYVVEITAPTITGYVSDTVTLIVLPQEGTVTPSPTPTVEPTATPIVEPTSTPTAEPTASPTLSPTPTVEPTSTPTVEPTSTPTAEPTATSTPTVEPTATPTSTPTAEPTATPTSTVEPTSTPTAEPTASPTPSPTPTAEPTATPTVEPTSTPTVEPTSTPTAEPTATPTAEPTATPTVEPTATPTPTAEPTATPTATPTVEPTATPTAEPTAMPTVEPTASPTATPSISVEDLDITYQNGLNQVPAGLLNTSYNTLDRIADALETLITREDDFASGNTQLWDVTLRVRADDGESWLLVTAENFPREGLDIVLPYPEGTSGATHDFVVSHMFTSNVNGHHPGELEMPIVTEREDGLHLRVDGFSPFMVGYKEVEQESSAQPQITAEPIEISQEEEQVKAPKMGDGMAPIIIVVISLLGIGFIMITLGMRRYDDLDF